MTTAYTECNAEGCSRTVASGAVMYRVAPKGLIGPWACIEHVNDERRAWDYPTAPDTEGTPMTERGAIDEGVVALVAAGLMVLATALYLVALFTWGTP